MLRLLIGPGKGSCSAVEAEAFQVESGGAIQWLHRLPKAFVQLPERALMTTTIFATVEAKPDSIHLVEQALCTMIPLTRAEPGCIRYELFVSEEHPGTFHLLETYADDNALSRHHTSPHFTALVVSLSDKLAQEIRIERVARLPHAIAE